MENTPKAIYNWQPYNTDVLSCKIPWRHTRQPAQLHQRHNNEDTESNVKLHTYKSNMEIPHQTSMHNTSTFPSVSPTWNMVMHYYMTFQKSIERLQMVQNICAKLVVQHSKYSSATQALMDLHWLPVEQCIHCRILTITYRAIKTGHQSTSWTYSDQMSR